MFYIKARMTQQPLHMFKSFKQFSVSCITGHAEVVKKSIDPVRPVRQSGNSCIQQSFTGFLMIFFVIEIADNKTGNGIRNLSPLIKPKGSSAILNKARQYTILIGTQCCKLMK